MRDSIEKLYLEYHARILAYIAWRLKSPGSDGLAEDLAAETFLRAMEAIRKGKGPQQPDGNAAPWLFRIAHNLVIDEYRERTRRPPPLVWDDLWSALDGEQSPLDVTISAEACALIDDAIARLDGLQSTVITMQGEGYSIAEIGAEIGKTAGAAKALLFRARVQLDELLRMRGLEANRSVRRYTPRRVG